LFSSAKETSEFVIFTSKTLLIVSLDAKILLATKIILKP